MPMAAPQGGIIPSTAKGNTVKLYIAAHNKFCLIIFLVFWAIVIAKGIFSKFSPNNTASDFSRVSSLA